jgi:predicted MFS family arabinose efflux permease
VLQYYALIAALYVLGCATGPIAYTRLVAAQFREARGTALAVAQFGIALIAVIMPPLVGGIMERWSWREAYLLFAVTTLVGGVVAWLVMRPVPAAPETLAGARPPGGTWAILRQGPFWLISLPIMLISIAAYGFVFQFQSVLISVGKDPRTATLLLSVLAFSTMVSRLVVGRLLDSARPTAWSAGIMLLAAVGPLLLLLPAPSLAIAVVAVLLVGISIGAELDLMSFFCARVFGVRQYSVVYGLLSIFFFVGMALGGVAFGAIHDVTGSFRPALVTMSALLVASALLFVMLGRVDRAPSRHSIS